MGLLTMLVVGVIAGLIARAIVPGPDPMGWIGTTLLGIVGSFVGGFLATLFYSHGNYVAFEPTGLLGSIIGAVVVLGLIHLVSHRRTLHV